VPVPIFICGDGRMGTALRRLLAAADPAGAGLELREVEASAAVVVDYSHPDWTGPLLKRLLGAPRPLLVGTTGLSEEIRKDIQTLAARAPVLVAANTGTGIAVLKTLVGQAVRMLGAGWDVEVLEMHHRKKLDAPSGTAWLLEEEAARARGDAAGLRDAAVSARVGHVGARTDGEIGVQALRGGDVVGEHTVYLVGMGERLELTHRCHDRDTFARGGLRAARWLAEPGRVAGLYTMDDVLGLPRT
jgi:4-hydroxy-tetrahydrodipicolinate reductase